MRLIGSDELKYGDFVVCNDRSVSVCTQTNYDSIIQRLGLSVIPVLTLGDANKMIASSGAMFDEYIDYWFSLSRSRLSSELVNNVKHEVCNSVYTVRKELYPLLLLKNFHPNTFRHCLDVAIYALVLNDIFFVADAPSIAIGGIFHDLGKLRVPTKILRKPAKLNHVEYEIIKQHPLIGYEIMKDKLPETALQIIKYHHLCKDGSGYPLCTEMKGKDIPLVIQLVTVCDMFDAIVSKRSYKSEQSSATAIDILRRDAEKGRVNKDFVDGLSRVISM